MKLSTRSRYGLRFLLELAGSYREGAVRTLHDLATSQEISEKYLWSLVPPLKHAGLIETVRGAAGGYRLAVDPGTVTIRDVIEILDGGIELTPCRNGQPGCTRQPVCPAASVWQEIGQQFDQVLQRYTLAEVLRRSMPAEGVMYSI